MKLYLSIIGFAMCVISALNIIFGVAAWYYIVIATVWCTALQFALDGTIAITVKNLPNGWFGITNPGFKVSDFEMRMYKRLRVRLWKDKVWELGGIGGFSKKRLLEPDNPEYIELFIIESNKGVVTHRLSYPIGFLAMLTLEGVTALTVALPVAAVNLFLNILPTLVLRYNTPKLHSLLKRLRQKKDSVPIKNL